MTDFLIRILDAVLQFLWDYVLPVFLIIFGGIATVHVLYALANAWDFFYISGVGSQVNVLMYAILYAAAVLSLPWILQKRRKKREQAEKKEQEKEFYSL